MSCVKQHWPVPRSIDDPIKTNTSNVDGFLNILELSKVNKVSSFTYAASSSTYGDSDEIPKVEGNIDLLCLLMLSAK